jgi:hypothetical protein
VVIVVTCSSYDGIVVIVVIGISRGIWCHCGYCCDR